MRTIRSFGADSHELSQAGRSRFLHPTPEEAIAAGVCALLADEDYVTSTHRGTAIRSPKEWLDEMMARSSARAPGVQGQGRLDAHPDVAKGMLAPTHRRRRHPLAIGAALSAKVRKTGGVAVAFSATEPPTRARFTRA